MNATLIAALGLGIAGSLHCAGMCGPIATVAGRGRRRDAALYLLLRSLSYALVGALLGLAGHRVAAWLSTDAVRVGSSLVVVVLSLYGAARVWRRPRASLVQIGAQRTLVQRILRTLPAPGPWLGIVNAILPCGMLGAAWLLASTTLHPVAGALTMFCFSVASAPGLIAPLAASVAGARVWARVPRIAQTIAWVGVGIWVGVRPLLSAMHHHH